MSSLDSEILKGMLALLVSFPIGTKLMMVPQMTGFLEGLPMSHTHIYKEVSDSTAHTSLSFLRSDRAEVKSLLSLTEAGTEAQNSQLTDRNESQSWNRVLEHTFSRPVPPTHPLQTQTLVEARHQEYNLPVVFHQCAPIFGLLLTKLWFKDHLPRARVDPKQFQQHDVVDADYDLKTEEPMEWL